MPDRAGGSPASKSGSEKSGGIMRQEMREINALKGRVCLVPPIGSPGQSQRQRGRSVQRCVKTDCLVAVRGRDDKR